MGAKKIELSGMTAEELEALQLEINRRRAAEELRAHNIARLKEEGKKNALKKTQEDEEMKTMEPEKTTKKAAIPQKAVVLIRGSQEFYDGIAAMAAYYGLSVSSMYDMAIRELARKLEYPEPLPPRGNFGKESQ